MSDLSFRANGDQISTGYQRFHIDTRPAPDIVPWPSRFKVDVSRVGLGKLLLREFIQFKGDLSVVLSRPCVYGVFSGAVGGFMPHEEKCVGCLRCTTQYPDFVQIRRNPERERLGDSYFEFEYVNSIIYEASTGKIPVKGAGYGGKFGGEGWDGMWTDMSEIVRPTRDGIHGREFISTTVDLGSKPGHLTFDESGNISGRLPRTFEIPLPILFDRPPAAVASDLAYRIWSEAAAAIGNLCVLPLSALADSALKGPHIVPLFAKYDANQLVRGHPLSFSPRLVLMDGWDESLFGALREAFPEASMGLRLKFGDGDDLPQLARAGVDVFHLTADYHGQGRDGDFIFDVIRNAHNQLVGAGIRDQVTLLGSGGIIAAEHVPKAIIAGLDAVAIDTAMLVALQGRFEGELVNQNSGTCHLPERLAAEWGVQRLKNLTAAWHQQLLEILGAMGLREVRRLRGEMGRAMFQKDLEREAFAGIEGYEPT